MSKEEFLRFIKNKLGSTSWLEIRMFILRIERELYNLRNKNICKNCKHSDIIEWGSGDININCKKDYVSFIKPHDFGCNKWEEKDETK